MASSDEEHRNPFLHRQLLKIRKEESHLREDLGEKFALVKMHECFNFSSKRILPPSPLSGQEIQIRVGRQVVNSPSFPVRFAQKHIDFSLTSPFGGEHPRRVKRKNQKAAAGGDGDEEEE